MMTKKGEGMNIEDVRRIFPDIEIRETTDGFQMLDRPFHPNAIIKLLDGKVEHLGGYLFRWK